MAPPFSRAAGSEREGSLTMVRSSNRGSAPTLHILIKRCPPTRHGQPRCDPRLIPHTLRGTVAGPWLIPGQAIVARLPLCNVPGRL